MARTKYDKRLMTWVEGKIKVMRLTNEYVASQLGMHRNTFSKKLQKGTLTYLELQDLFAILGADPDIVLNLMGKTRRGK